MKVKNKITALLAMLALTACHDDVTAPTYTVGEAVNAITMRAGINEGGEIKQTRAVDDNHAGNANGGAHTNFTQGTQLRLRVDGTWKSTTVTKTTTGNIGDKTGADAKHNKVNFSTTSNPVEQLYWDDYGTADPANATTGRTEGLTIYGVAVDGETTAPAVSSWTALSWDVGTPANNVINQTSGWSTKDLLTSNNIQKEQNDVTYATDGTYKFQSYIDDLKNETTTSSNLLEFTHAMTKITVNLTAGEGFPGYETGTANAKFQTAPTVKLLGFNYTGTVNVETKTSSPTAATTDINMYLAEGGANNNKAKYDAIVFPGNQFSATIADDAPKYTPSSATNILELNADGNIYKVTAAQLVKAMNAVGSTGEVNGTLEQAKNYILNITVDKTQIKVTATIKNWIDVPTEEAKPKINVTATYGYTAGAVTGSTSFTNNYDLFRSTDKATGYDEDNTTDGIQPAASYITSTAWNKTIYWPNHQTHYFFRGVYPQVGTEVFGTTSLASPEAVTTESSNDVVAVANATYKKATYPSDLAIAFPRETTAGSYDETCKAGHKESDGTTAKAGICATEGIINMNFEYAMSKVEVRLKSNATDEKARIALTKDNTKVEIIGGYSKARIKLSDGLHDAYADADKGTYTLSNIEPSETGILVTTLDAIVPQEIGDDVIFRITYTNDNGTPSNTFDDTKDVYECKVNLIKETTNNTLVKEWEHGKHYIYILDLNKTAIKVVATLKDWVPVEATDNVWF